MKTTSLELFFFDHCEGVHQNLLQRLKPRCLFEIELRPSWGQRFSTLIDPIGPVEVNTERLVPGKPHLPQEHCSSASKVKHHACKHWRPCSREQRSTVHTSPENFAGRRPNGQQLNQGNGSQHDQDNPSSLAGNHGLQMMACSDGFPLRSFNRNGLNGRLHRCDLGHHRARCGVHGASRLAVHATQR